MLAVHFGAGNIGRGFIGAALQDAGYHVVFADVSSDLVAELNSAASYRVIELGGSGSTRVYEDFEAIDSIVDRERLVQTISEADLVTASVGASILPRIAGVIAEGLKLRTLPNRCIVMACENAINATDALAREILSRHPVESKAVFCNTAVDRIVPLQPGGLSPSVEVEAFSEWIIEAKGLRANELQIPAATLVQNLAPFIERKLFTVNTAHCAVAYLGQRAGYDTVATAMRDEQIFRKVQAILDETSTALIAKFGFDESDHADYVEKTLSRLSNKLIDDQVVRVGRQPLRKLSRNERLISPAAYLAEHGTTPIALLEAVAAALEFKSEDDPEVALLQAQLDTLTPEQFVTQVFGIGPSHPLFVELIELVIKRQALTMKT